MNKIIFFGEDVFSLRALEGLYSSTETQISFVVILGPVSRSGQKLLNFVIKRNIPYEVVSKITNSLIAKLLTYDFDFIISCHFQRILPVRLFKEAKVAAINLHPSLLPKYRGLTPHHWALYNGEIITAITVHIMDEKMDNGEIVIQEKIRIEPDMYIHDLQKIFLNSYPRILQKAVKLLVQDPKNTYPQVGEPSYFPRATEKDAQIVATDSVAFAMRKIRAFSSPYWGCRYKNVIIYAAELPNDEVSMTPEMHLALKRDGMFLGRDLCLLQLIDGLLNVTKWKKIEC